MPRHRYYDDDDDDEDDFDRNRKKEEKPFDPSNREERQEDDTKKKDTASLQMMHAKIELLSRQEQEVCKLLKLTPAQYLACKGGVLREAAGGPVRKSRVKALMNVEKGRASRLCAPYCKP